MSVSRRSFLSATPLLLAPIVRPFAQKSSTVSSSFPTQPPEMAREMVGASHRDLARVKALLAVHPTLANASWDWGFGDWEDAIGAASHVGNREIAAVLLAHGARATIFTAAMLGQLDAVRALITASPGIEATPGPHGITLLRHAMAGGPGAEPVVEYLKTLPAADMRPDSQALSAEAMSALTGDYVFGSGTDDRIVIAVSSVALTFTRANRSARNLVHVGDRTFFPVGAPKVRIRFRDTAAGMLLTVHDPDLVLEATRAR